MEKGISGKIANRLKPGKIPQAKSIDISKAAKVPNKTLTSHLTKNTAIKMKLKEKGANFSDILHISHQKIQNLNFRHWIS